MMEAASVADALGYASSYLIVESHMSYAASLLTKKKPLKPSMMMDVKEGRRSSMEVENIVGNVVRMARKVNVDTLTLDLLYVLIKGLSLSAEKVRI